MRRGLIPFLLDAARWLLHVSWLWRWESPASVDRDRLVASLRGGTRLTLPQWLALDEGTQDTLAAAGRVVAAEDAISVAACVHGGAGDVSSVIDGGAAADEVTLGQALNGALVRRFGGGR